jgi:hypothetical protein
MENMTDTLKKAFYLGVGLASYAGEQVGDIQGKAQSLADEPPSFLIRGWPRRPSSQSLRKQETSRKKLRFYPLKM